MKIYEVEITINDYPHIIYIDNEDTIDLIKNTIDELRKTENYYINIKITNTYEFNDIISNSEEIADIEQTFDELIIANENYYKAREEICSESPGQDENTIIKTIITGTEAYKIETDAIRNTIRKDLYGYILNLVTEHNNPDKVQ